MRQKWEFHRCSFIFGHIVDVPNVFSLFFRLFLRLSVDMNSNSRFFAHSFTFEKRGDTDATNVFLVHHVNFIAYESSTSFMLLSHLYYYKKNAFETTYGKYIVYFTRSEIKIPFQLDILLFFC